METPTQVVAALIWRDGRFLICRRPPHKMRGGLYEFVGGKLDYPAFAGRFAFDRVEKTW